MAGSAASAILLKPEALANALAVGSAPGCRSTSVNLHAGRLRRQDTSQERGE